MLIFKGFQLFEFNVSGMNVFHRGKFVRILTYLSMFYDEEERSLSM